MSNATIDPAPTILIPKLSAQEIETIRVSVPRVMRAEWMKLRTLRSSWLTMALAIVAVPGIGIAIAWSTANEWNQMRDRHREHFNPLADPLSGFHLAQLAVGVLGILLVAGEYSAGMIRATFAAVPRRLPVLWSKVAVFTTLTLATMVPVSIVTFFVSQRLLAVHHIQTTWSAPTVARTVIGVGLYLTVVAALAMGLGAIIRNVAGAIGAFVGVLLVLPVIALALPVIWADRINKWLPSNAGQALLGESFDSTSLAPWTGFAVFCAYAVGMLIIASVLLRRRDA